MRARRVESRVVLQVGGDEMGKREAKLDRIPLQELTSSHTHHPLNCSAVALSLANSVA